MFDRFRAFSIRQQVFLGLGTACAVLLVLGMTWFFMFRTAYMPLFTQLRPADAATIVADLERRKISYRLENGGATILVPEEVVDSTRLDVMSGDLPFCSVPIASTQIRPEGREIWKTKRHIPLCWSWTSSEAWSSVSPNRASS